MALTRAMLKGMGLTEEQVSAIIEEHTTVTGGLKDQIKQYKEDAEKLPEVQKELDGLKNGNNDWEQKYEKEHKAFDDYKKEVSDKETLRKVQSAYKKLLTTAGVDEQRIDAIMKVTDFSNMKLDNDENLVDADKLTETIKETWKGFLVTVKTTPAQVQTPPNGGGDNSNSVYVKNRAQMYHENLYGKTKEGE